MHQQKLSILIVLCIPTNQAPRDHYHTDCIGHIQKLKKSEMLYIQYRNANVQQSGTVSRASTHNVIFLFNQVVL